MSDESQPQSAYNRADEIRALWKSIDDGIEELGTEGVVLASIVKFHRFLDNLISYPNFAMLTDDDADVLELRGQFTIEQLKSIVQAWEEYQNANDVEHDSTPK